MLFRSDLLIRPFPLFLRTKPFYPLYHHPAVPGSVKNQEAIKRSVANGMGISIISRLAAEEEIRAGKVLWRKVPGEGEGRDINIVYNKNFHLSKSAERFIRVVKEMYEIQK